MLLVGWLAALLLTCLPSAGETDDPLQIHRISEVRSICPGKPFFVGMHLVHPPGNCTHIFGHGFTIKTNGHGFGLHGIQESAASSA